MKLQFRHALGSGLLAAAAFAGCSAIERGIDQFERGFDDEPPSQGFRPGVHAEPYTETAPSATTPIAEPASDNPPLSLTPPTPSTTLRRSPRPTDFLIEPEEDGPALVPPPAPAPLPIENTPAAFRDGTGTIRPICFSTSCCPSVINCDPCCAPFVTCDPCSTSCCPGSCFNGCGESLLSKMRRRLSNMNGRIHCFKTRVKSRLSGLNPFSCSAGCSPCATCCDPCASCCTPGCDPCCDGVVLDGIVVGSYPINSGFAYGGPSYGPTYSHGAMNYSNNPQGYYAPQAGHHFQQHSTWQPQQQQYPQARTWQNQGPQQQQPFRPTYQPAPQQYGSPQQYESPQQYSAPRYSQPQENLAPNDDRQPVPADQPPVAVPGENANPDAAGPAPPTSDPPGTALLGPGYSPRTVPVTRHLQTTYTTFR